MPDIHGAMGDGKFGVMSEAQSLDWLVGCTIFYAKRDDDVAKVVGIGSHTSSSSYDVYWSVSHCLGKSVSL
jgi:hypothetical protein